MSITDYIKRLPDVPHLFQLKVFRHVFEKFDKAEKYDMYDVYDSKILEVPQGNLASFVYFLLKQQTESKDENEKVLDKHPTNINANCMKVVLSAHAKNEEDAEELLKQLNKLKEDRFLVAEAEAELAFAYSEMGPEFYIEAISKLRKVIEEQPEQPNQYEWKYILALIRRKCQNPKNRKLLSSTLNYTDNFVLCKELFEDIENNCSDNTLKALSLMEKAVLFMDPNSRDVDFRKLGIDKGEIRGIIIQYLDKALEYDGDNGRVLSEKGRILRKFGKLKEAREILEDAVRLFPENNDTAHHHLALTISKKLERITPEVIQYLEKGSRSGLNPIVTIDLGKAYLKLNPPNYEKALESFHRLDGSEYDTMRLKYFNLSECYEAMIDQTTDQSAYQKSLEMNKQAIIFGILFVIKSTPKEASVKFNFTELFPGKMKEKRNYDYTNKKESILQQVHLFEGKSDYIYLNRLQSLIKGGSLDAINYEIKKDLDEGKYEDCLEMVLFLLITDLDGIDQVVISTMMKILQVAVETGRKTLASKCLLWPMEYFYMVDNSLGHFRILADSDGGKEAEMIETWLVDLGMIVVRNDEDISPFSDRREALIESLQANVAVFCIIKGNNSNLLDEYPINMLPSDKPYLIPVIVDDSKVPNVLQGYQPLNLPPKDDDREKASWLKSVGETILRC